MLCSSCSGRQTVSLIRGVLLYRLGLRIFLKQQHWQAGISQRRIGPLRILRHLPPARRTSQQPRLSSCQQDLALVRVAQAWICICCRLSRVSLADELVSCLQNMPGEQCLHTLELVVALLSHRLSSQSLSSSQRSADPLHTEPQLAMGKFRSLSGWWLQQLPSRLSAMPAQGDCSNHLTQHSEF